MAMFTQESLDALRQRIDLVEVLGPYVDLKRAGASYKGLCPFHDEKSPSFVVQKGDSHYHCFGCGAHGDAIQFLMSHAKLHFGEAVEALAQRFSVPLQYVEGSKQKDGVNKAALKQALEAASQLFEFLLLHTEQGDQALAYLYGRGIDLEFIKQFRLGLAPAQSGILQAVLHEQKISNQNMLDAGLLTELDNGRWRDFFYDRITFPICDASGAIIGFSARKYKEATSGGKYVNTSETPLFKKSYVLFALHYSRRRIAKERKAIIVEGQIDALRLIASGFNMTVAGQGTAFGEGHVKELLNLGVATVYLALDPDVAGQQAAIKIGDLFQKEGVEVKVIALPPQMDPDAFIRKRGAEAFQDLMESAVDYLTFLVQISSKESDSNSPAAKNELVTRLVKQIRGWNHPLMVHESLRKVSQLLNVPEDVIGVGQDHIPNIHLKKSSFVGLQTIDPDRIMEGDFLLWLLLMNAQHPRFLEIARNNLTPADLIVPACSKLYQVYLDRAVAGQVTDLFSLAAFIGEPEQLLIHELMQKKVNQERADQHFQEAIQRILDRNWMKQRQKIAESLKADTLDEEAAFETMRLFNELQKNPPSIKKSV